MRFYCSHKWLKKNSYVYLKIWYLNVFLMLICCLSSITDSSSFLSFLVDSEQEVPPGTTESVQSVDYYCDSKCKCNLLTVMLETDLCWMFSSPALF